MQAVFAKILNMSLTGSIVIAVVLLARLFLKRAPKIYSYALWAVVLFRLLCPLSITAGLSVLKPIPVTTTPGISAVSYQPVAQAVRENIPAPVQQQFVPAQPTEQSEAKLAPMQVAAYIWLGGASVMAVYSIAQYWILRRRLAEAVLLQGEIYLADRISSPFVMGVIRPNIYLPSSTPMMERRFIVAHERHHIRRGDPVWKLLGYIALCLHWFNPLVWLAFVLAGKDMEMSCDEAVIKQLGEHIRADYSQALLRLATHKKIIAGMPLAFGEGDTKGRVMNMAKWKKPKLWVSIVCFVLCGIILVACAVNPKTVDSSADMNSTEITGEITCADRLNIREKPDLLSAVVGNYYNGAIVTILETKDGWGRTDMGWISMDYVTTIDDTTLDDSTESVPVPTKLNIRKEPDASSAVVGQYSNGTIITILETKDGWGRTDQGWIVMDYVTMTDDSTGIITIRDAESEAGMSTVAGSDMQTALNKEKEALQQCRSVLEQIQSNGACKIETKQENGPNALNETTLRTDWIHGKDRLHICLIPESGGASMFGGLLVDGAKYECDSAQQWREITWWDWTDPWLVSFQWDDSVVAYLDTLTDESGTTVMLRIDQPFAAGENEQPHYFVNFNFDADSTFRNVNVQANVFTDNAITKTESIVSLDSKTVNAEIQKEYRRAIG